MPKIVEKSLCHRGIVGENTRKWIGKATRIVGLEVQRIVVDLVDSKKTEDCGWTEGPSCCHHCLCQ